MERAVAEAVAAVMTGEAVAAVMTGLLLLLALMC